MADLFENPVGLDGFEFVEFASPDPESLAAVFHMLGFQKAAVHRSKQVEAGVPREVGLELAIAAVGEKASLLAAARLGCTARITGFLAAKSLRSRAPVLHIDTIEFLEGTNHGIQASNEA